MVRLTTDNAKGKKKKSHPNHGGKRKNSGRFEVDGNDRMRALIILFQKLMMMIHGYYMMIK